MIPIDQIGSMAHTQDMRRLKRIQFILTFIYGVISMLLFMASFIFINFISTFQIATICTVHLITGTMIFLLISFNAVERSTLSSDKTVFIDEKAASRYKEQLILRFYKIATIIIVIVTVITTIALSVYLYNLIITLFIECPRFDAHHSSTNAFSRMFQGIRHNPEKQQYNSTLDIIVNYNDNTDKHHILLLKYDLNERQIVQKSRQKESMDWFDSNVLSIKQTLIPVCSDEKISRYHFLEREIKDAITMRIQEFNNQQSIIIKNHQNNHQSNPVEDSILLEFQTRYICRNEYGFAAFIIAFILSVELLNVAVSSWFIYLRINIP